MRRHLVASTLARRRYDVMGLLGYMYLNSMHNLAPEVIKIMLNSTEHGIVSDHKC